MQGKCKDLCLNRMHNQIIHSVDRKKNDTNIVHTDGDLSNEKNSFKTSKLKKDFDIIKEDDEYKISLSKIRFPMKITNFMTKINTSKNSQLKSMTERTPVIDRVVKSRNDKKSKNLVMNLTFTDKLSTNTNNYSQMRHTSDPDNLRSVTPNSSITNKKKKINNLSVTLAKKSNNNNNTNNISLTLNSHKETSYSKSTNKKENFKKESKDLINNSNTKTLSDYTNIEINSTNANYLDTMQSQDASSSSSRKNSFNVNPSYLYYFQEKKKKTNHFSKLPENKKGISVYDNKCLIVKLKDMMVLSTSAVQLPVFQMYFEKISKR